MTQRQSPTDELDRYETPVQRLEALNSIIDGEQNEQTEVEILEELTAARDGMQKKTQQRGGRSR